MATQSFNIPKQLKAALRKYQTGLGRADDATLAAFLATKTLDEIVALRGAGRKTVSDYAMESGRAEELFECMEAGWQLDGVDRRALEIGYYHKRLKEEFISETFNDEQNLKHLAQLYAIRRELTLEVRDLDGTSNERSRVVRELATIESSITTLEKHLEIDPSTRGMRTAKEETSDLVSELVDTATDYLVDEGVAHVTNHGAAGLTIWYFKTPQYMPRCSVCGNQEFVFRSPWDEQEFPFMVATPQQVANYVAAASFIPDGAPNIELFSETWPSNKDNS